MRPSSWLRIAKLCALSYSLLARLRDVKVTFSAAESYYAMSTLESGENPENAFGLRGIPVLRINKTMLVC